jgi:hypothetical protein
MMMTITDCRASRRLFVDDNGKPREGKNKWDWKEGKMRGGEEEKLNTKDDDV